MYTADYGDGCELAISKFPEFRASGLELVSVHPLDTKTSPIHLQENSTLWREIALTIKEKESEFVAGGCHC